MILLSVLFSGHSAFAQISASPLFSTLGEQSLLFSQSNVSGSARYLGIGGSGVALGGDISAALYNPAGLGFFNKSVIAFTPTFDYKDNRATYINNSQTAFTPKVGISNFGIIFNNTKESLRPTTWRGGSFAITYNRTNNFSSNYDFAGQSDKSILKAFVTDATNGDGGRGLLPQDVDANIKNGVIGIPEAAYDNFLINPYAVPDTNLVDYYYPVLIENPEVSVSQSGSIKERGNQSQWNFSYGGNFLDKIYVGASIGFKSLNYERNRLLVETYNGQNDEPVFPIPDNDQLSIDRVDLVQYEDNLTLSGSGADFSLGVIYRPVNEVTFGLAYESPTIYSVVRRQSFLLTNTVRGIQIDDNTAPKDYIDRRTSSNPYEDQLTLRTPANFKAGLSYFFEKYGFVSASANYSQFGNASYSTSEQDAAVEVDTANSVINNDLQSVLTINVGGEFRYNIFRVRLGYVHSGDPTNVKDPELLDVDESRQTFTGGLGIYLPKLSADLAVIRANQNVRYEPYFGSEFEQRRNNSTQVSLTLGFNF